MSASKDSESRSGTPPDGPGVLSNLPRTRPQRSSPRRAAAREATAMAAGATETSARSTPRPAKRLANTNGSPTQKAGAGRGEDADTGAMRPTKAARSSTRTRRPQSASGRDRFVEEEAVPKQGFECEGEGASGPVQPPGGAELLASAGEIFSEVAKAGFSTGERLFRDVLSRLPIS